MTTAITKESLAALIAELESGARSLKEDYTLAAYKMLLATMEAEPVYQVEGTVEKDENGQVTKLEWVDVPYSVAVRAWDEFGLLTRTLYKSPPAKMGVEPVAYIPESQLNLLERAVMVEADLSKVQRFDEIPLYRHAQPAPVVPECFYNALAALESLYRNGQKQGWHARYTTDMAYASGVINACRASLKK